MANLQFDVRSVATQPFATIAICLLAAILFGSAGAAESPNPDKESLDKLIKGRAVYLGAAIDDEVAKNVIAKLLFLKSVTNTPITLCINSPGGSATAGLAIVETIESLNCEVKTICVGRAQAMAAIILASGSRGSRGSVTNATIGFAEVWTKDPPSPEKQVHLARLRTKLLEKTAKATGQPTNEIEKLFVSERRLTGAEVVRLGVIDHEVNVSGR